MPFGLLSEGEPVGDAAGGAFGGGAVGVGASPAIALPMRVESNEPPAIDRPKVTGSVMLISFQVRRDRIPRQLAGALENSPQR